MGDIPYTKAGSLESTSTIANATFDAQAELYIRSWRALKRRLPIFSTATANPTFSKADILLSGSVDKWQRYANSVRLRLLMRISNVNESTAQSEVLDMLNNKAPLVDGGNAPITPWFFGCLLQRLTTHVNSLKDGFDGLPPSTSGALLFSMSNTSDWAVDSLRWRYASTT